MMVLVSIPVSAAASPPKRCPTSSTQAFFEPGIQLLVGLLQLSGAVVFPVHCNHESESQGRARRALGGKGRHAVHGRPGASNSLLPRLRSSGPAVSRLSTGGSGGLAFEPTTVLILNSREAASGTYAAGARHRP